MGRAAVVLAFASACSFMPRAAERNGDAGIDAPDIDAPDGGGSGSGSGSGSAGTAHRKPIVIDKTKLTGMLDNFPMWIDLADTQIAAQARADGHDIYFTDSNGVALPHEIESFAGGRLLAWVRVPHLDMAVTLTIYIGYGDDSRAVAQDPHTVFAGYSAVWHLDDAGSSTSIADATGTHPGTPTGLAPGSQVSAKLAGGIAFDGSGNQSISFTSPLVGTGAHTISAWVNQGNTNNHSAIVAVGTNGTDQARFLYANFLNSGTLAAGQYNDDWVPAGNDLRNAGWRKVDWTYEGTNKKTHVFVDGKEIMGSPHTSMNMANTPASTGLIGAAPAGFGAAEMLGTLDEVRIATTIRMPNWFATEFANQSSPSTFYTLGAEQAAP